MRSDECNWVSANFGCSSQLSVLESQISTCMEMHASEVVLFKGLIIGNETELSCTSMG